MVLPGARIAGDGVLTEGTSVGWCSLNLSNPC